MCLMTLLSRIIMLILFFHSLLHLFSGYKGNRKFINTNTIIPVSSRGAKKIPSLCSEQAERSHKVNVIARSAATRQSHPIKTRLPCFLRSLAMTIYCKRLPRCTRNGGLPRPFRVRNDIVKIYVAFMSVRLEN